MELNSSVNKSCSSPESRDANIGTSRAGAISAIVGGGIVAGAAALYTLANEWGENSSLTDSGNQGKEGAPSLDFSGDTIDYHEAIGSPYAAENQESLIGTSGLIVLSGIVAILGAVVLTRTVPSLMRRDSHKIAEQAANGSKDELLDLPKLEKLESTEVLSQPSSICFDSLGDSVFLGEGQLENFALIRKAGADAHIPPEQAALYSLLSAENPTFTQITQKDPRAFTLEENFEACFYLIATSCIDIHCKESIYDLQPEILGLNPETTDFLNTRKNEIRTSTSILSDDYRKFNYEGTEREKKASHTLKLKHQLLIDFFSTKESVHPLLDKDGLFYNQILSIHNPSLREEYLRLLPHLLTHLNNEFRASEDDFKHNKTPLFPIFCSLIMCLSTENAKIIYEKIMGVKKVLKDKNKTYAFMSFLNSIVSAPLEEADKMNIISGIIDNKKHLSRLSVEWRLALNGLLEYSIQEGSSIVSQHLSLAKKQKIKNPINTVAGVLILAKSLERMGLSPECALNNTLIQSCPNLAVIPCFFDRFDSSWRYGPERVPTRYMKAIFEKNYFKLRLDNLQKEDGLSEEQANKWSTPWSSTIQEAVGSCETRSITAPDSTVEDLHRAYESARRSSTYTIEDSNNPWDLFLGTSRINGCESLLKKDNIGLKLLSLLDLNSLRIVHVKNPKGSLVARSYIHLDPRGKCCFVNLIKGQRDNRDFDYQKMLSEHIDKKVIDSLGKDWKVLYIETD